MKRPSIPHLTTATRRALLGAAAVSWLAPAALAETAAEPAQIGEPPPGKGQIVFFRKGAYAGFVDSYMVRDEAGEVGRLYSGSYFVVAVEPGLRTYMVRAEAKRRMQIFIDAGETYYVICELGAGGIILYQPDLTPSEQWLFTRVSPGLRKVEPKAPG